MRQVASPPRPCPQDPAARPSARELLGHSWITYNRRTLRSSWSRTRGLKARQGRGAAVPGERAGCGVCRAEVCCWRALRLQQRWAAKCAALAARELPQRQEPGLSQPATALLACRGVRTDAHATVSTVVERMLQVSAPGGRGVLLANICPYCFPCPWLRSVVQASALR